ncbi:MAG: methylthioribose-1-phosphate isomerase [Planctomycetota bacterium]|jgi:methylthioribose-1-phosphate isomerase
MHPQTLSWIGDLSGHVRMIEQTLLPEVHEEIDVRDVSTMVDAIYRLAVRGAPAIGVAAAFGMVLGVQQLTGQSAQQVMTAVRATRETLDASRPTAVNLSWATRRMLTLAEECQTAGADGDGIIAALHAEAGAIFDGDQATCRAMGEIGAELIPDGARLLTHCNAGALATAGLGTALAPMYVAHEQGKRISVYADETRPLLQGARITAWELSQAGIDVTVITDSMAPRVMSEGKIDAVFVGSDRIARNGDVCNKIGTYGVALAAQFHKIPFYVVAPLSTVDPSVPDGSGIPIEEREEQEITEGFGKRTVPKGVKVYNPAFDVTPAKWVTGIITEVGLVEAPNTAKMEAALRRGGVTF